MSRRLCGVMKNLNATSVGYSRHEPISMFSLPCTVEILNRLAISSGKNGKFWMARKAVINFKKCKVTGSVFICFSTAKDLDAYKCSVQTVGSIMQTFLHEGKLTLMVNYPPFNVMLRDAKVQDLEQFIEQLKKYKDALGNGLESSGCNASTSAIPSTSKIANEEKSTIPDGGDSALEPLKKRAKLDVSDIKNTLKSRETVLKVTRQSDYPRNGFSEYLKIVTLSGINLKKIDPKLLKLKSLTQLNLSKNSLTSIDPLMHLQSKLMVLTVDQNKLESISDDFFDAPSLRGLTQLSLNQNLLKVLPRSIVRLGHLRNLSASNNKLRVLPYNLHLLRSLGIFAVAGNELTFLPRPLMNLRLQNLDVSKNPLRLSGLSNDSTQCTTARDVPSLLELTAQFVATNNYKWRSQPTKILPVSSDQIPRIACEVIDSCKWCSSCDKMACRYSFKVFPSSSAASSVIYDSVSKLPTKVAVCEYCKKKTLSLGM